MRTRLFDFSVGGVRDRLVAGRRVLLVSPLFAVVALISLSDERTPWSARGFHVASLFYPVVYFVCLDLAVALQSRKNERAARNVSIVPLWYFVVVSALALIFLAVDSV